MQEALLRQSRPALSQTVTVAVRELWRLPVPVSELSCCVSARERWVYRWAREAKSIEAAERTAVTAAWRELPNANSTKQMSQNTLPEGGVQTFSHRAFVLNETKTKAAHKEETALPCWNIILLKKGLSVSKGGWFTTTCLLHIYHKKTHFCSTYCSSSTSFFIDAAWFAFDLALPHAEIEK